jgi:hypothetical protein
MTAQRLGVGLINTPKNAFASLALDRHSAAHDQSFDIPSVTLKDSLTSALAIGLCFDVVLSAAIANLNTSLARNGRIVELKAADIQLRFLCSTARRGRYSVRKAPMNGPSLRSGVDIDDVRAQGMATMAGLGTLLVHDTAGRPLSWYSV